MAKKLHYNKEALLKEYKHTFKIMLLGTAAVVLFGVTYFFIMATYLGTEGHTKHKPYFDKFVEDGRIGSNYEGLKLKAYEKVEEDANAEYYTKKPHVKGEHAAHEGEAAHTDAE